MSKKNGLTSILFLFSLSHKINLIIATVCIFCFAWLSWQVVQENLNEFDEFFLEWLHEILPSWFIYIAKPIYFIGEAEVAVFFVLLSLIILAWKRLWLEAQTVALSSLSILLLIDKVFKPWFHRSRPLGRLLDNIHGRSFPSGHVSGNLLLYFLLIYIISLRFPQYRNILYAIATFVLILMGISSNYLRVHWATDILAGYCLGYIFFSICIILLKIGDKKYI
jgi:undecaprenyl-diphosphatase